MANLFHATSVTQHTMYMNFTSGEQGLKCPYIGTPNINLGNTDYGLWTMFTNPSDHFDNFGGFRICGPDNYYRFQFHSFKLDGIHRLESPTGDAGFDLEGLAGNYKSYGIGFHFNLHEYPDNGEISWLMFSGQTTDNGYRLGVYRLK